jgi:outer membrane cobalamin receptor
MRSLPIVQSAENARRSSQTRSCFVIVLVASTVVFASATAVAAPAPGEAPGTSETIVVFDPDLALPASEDEAASASVITVERTPRSAETLPDLLAGLPGVTVSRLGGIGAPALLSLRGSTTEQVSVYLDGVNMNVAAGGGVDISTLPVGDIERVEIYRGATPMAFGSSAIGGVLSVETRRPQLDGVKFELGTGSFGTWFGGGGVSVVGKRYGVYVGLHGLRSAGDFAFPDNKGTAFDPSDDEVVARRNNRLREGDGTLRGAISLPGSRELSWIALAFDRYQGLPGYPRYATAQSALHTRRGVLSLAYKSNDELGANSLLRAQLHGYALEQRFVDPISEIAASPTDARDRTLVVGATVRGRWAPSPWIAPAVLLDVRGESFVPVDLKTDERGVASSRVSGAVGAEAAFRLGAARLSMTPSLRLELSRDVSAGRDNFGGLAGPDLPVVRALPIARLAITQSPRDGILLRANAGRYVRLPSFVELYGNTGFILGNRELAPERGTTADVGAAYDISAGALALTADAAAFAVMTEDLIQFQYNAYGVARARNIGRARILGIESSGELRFHAASLYAQLTWTDARDRSNSAAAADRQLPYRPLLHLTVRPELRRMRVGAVEVGAYLELDVSSGNYVDPANLVRLPSRVLLGAGASLQLDDGRVRLVASASNVTDASVIDMIAYPLPGRAFYLTIAFATESFAKEP